MDQPPIATAELTELVEMPTGFFSALRAATENRPAASWPPHLTSGQLAEFILALRGCTVREGSGD